MLRRPGRIATACAVMMVMTFSAIAHEMTFKGTVAGIDPARIQVKTGEEKKGDAPAWYPIDAKTKIFRGKTVVTFDQAKITTGERVVVLVEHQSDGKMLTLEIHLAAQP